MRTFFVCLVSMAVALSISPAATAAVPRTSDGQSPRLTIVIAETPTAKSDDYRGGIRPRTDAGQVVIDGRDRAWNESSDSGSSSSGSGRPTRLVPASDCISDALPDGQRGDFQVCDPRPCGDDGEGQLHYVQEFDGTGWTSSEGATECVIDGEPVGPDFTNLTLEDIRDQAIAAAPATTITVEPGDRTYVNVPTNFSAHTDQVTETVNVLDYDLDVTITPVAYRWEFGDGAHATGPGIEGAAIGQPGAVEHAYHRAGETRITVVRQFEVTVHLPDGETLELDGTLSTRSEPYTLDIGEIQTVVRPQR